MINTIIVQPEGGLANRMRALDSALTLARDLDAPIELVWTADGMRCRFNELFIPSDAIQSVRNLHNKTLWTVAKRKLYFASLQARRTRSIDRAGSVEIGSKTQEWRDLLEEGPLRIVSCYRFYPNDNPYTDFLFSTDIAAQVRSATAGWQSKMIGVHIRRTDNVRSVKHSPTERIIEAVHEAMTQMPDAGIFLATDDDAEEAAMKQVFGDKLHFVRKSSRDRRVSVASQDALVDLICLSKTSTIVGSAGSSFSSVSAALGRVPLTVVGGANDKFEKG